MPPEDLADLLVDVARLAPPSPAELARWAGSQNVFVSSVMTMGDERDAAIRAIREVGANPVAWEFITPRPVPPDIAWLGGVDSSHAIVTILGSQYGVRRDTGFSATHEETRRAEARGIERWFYVDGRVDAAHRDGDLRRWLEEIRSLYSYATFWSPDDLGASVSRSLSDLAAIRLYTWLKCGPLVFRADEHHLSAPAGTWVGSGGRGILRASGQISDARIRAALSDLRLRATRMPLVVDGQLFEAQLDAFDEGAVRGLSGYEASFSLSTPRDGSGILWATFSSGNRTWSAVEQATLLAGQILGLSTDAHPFRNPAPTVDWRRLLSIGGGQPSLLSILAELVAGEALLASGAMSRIVGFEARLAGPPKALVLGVRGITQHGHGSVTGDVEVTGAVPLV